MTLRRFNCNQQRVIKYSNSNKDPGELEDNDYTETRRKLNQLFEELSVYKQKADKSNEEIKLKYEHCLNVAFEISKLLNAILTNYRLGFYAQENKERCEKKILELKVLLGKILSSKSSILSEVYSEDKLKALRVISDQIDMKSNVTREKLNRMTSLIASYNSLGKEFDPILAQYKQLKNELERKNFTLNTLKKDNIIWASFVYLNYLFISTSFFYMKLNSAILSKFFFFWMRKINLIIL